MSEMYTEIGARLVTARGCLGLSQDVFAELLECSEEEMADCEAGKLEPSQHLLTHLAAELNISPKWIMTGEGEVYLEDDELAAYEQAVKDEIAARKVDTKSLVIEKIKAMDDQTWDALYAALKVLFE